MSAEEDLLAIVCELEFQLPRILPLQKPQLTLVPSPLLNIFRKKKNLLQKIPPFSRSPNLFVSSHRINRKSNLNRILVFNSTAKHARKAFELLS
jgi:hypothetical protein